MNTYKIFWNITMCASKEIEANSLEEALEKADKIEPFEPNTSPVDAIWEIDGDYTAEYNDFSEENLRRDEKNGLYGEHVDIAN